MPRHNNTTQHDMNMNTLFERKEAAHLEAERLNDSSPCTLVAFCTVTGRPFEEVQNELKRMGREPGRGLNVWALGLKLGFMVERTNTMPETGCVLCKCPKTGQGHMVPVVNFQPVEEAWERERGFVTVGMFKWFNFRPQKVSWFKKLLNRVKRT